MQFLESFPRKATPHPANLSRWMQPKLSTASPEQIIISSAGIKRHNDSQYLPAKTAYPAAITAFGNDKPFPATHVEPSKRPPLRTSSSSPLPTLSPSGVNHPELQRTGNTHRHQLRSLLEKEEEEEDDSNFESDTEDQMSRPALLRQNEGRSHLPLLQDNRGRPPYDSPDDPNRRTLSRRSQMRSRSPDATAQLADRRKYTYAAFFLGLSLVSFVIQTETAVYIQHELGWNKAYCMLYLTHGSWFLLWPVQLLILRIRKHSVPWRSFWRQHVYLLRTTGQMVASQELHPTGRAAQRSPIRYLLTRTAIVTSALTIAGGSWYLAVDLTSASDLTAIYNCSAFFAYAFSIPLLREKPRADKILSVLLAVVGVLIVAYGDTSPTKHGGKSGGAIGGAPENEESEAKNRVAGNIVIGIGSVLYGFYEVLYKKLACPPEGASPGRGMIFANTFGSLIGSFTLLVLWIPLPILHYMGWETFELPRGEAAWMMLISVLANASVPLSAAALTGGFVIIAAFLLLSWSTFREMNEDKRKKVEDDISDSSDTDDS
ncbi:hypothetical protein FGG08_005874 [Glutinoglossum americanum]|uniref:EamA domain-containing protein n=1 Tax=Glutinoglossum americanum TaxID=1670608 RepID=A0A9P8HZI4_9PEZI|nr:hypothetical protein FGG08_005874 [Glutinoglossum americanum]